MHFEAIKPDLFITVAKRKLQLRNAPCNAEYFKSHTQRLTVSDKHTFKWSSWIKSQFRMEMSVYCSSFELEKIHLAEYMFLKAIVLGASWEKNCFFLWSECRHFYLSLEHLPTHCCWESWWNDLVFGRRQLIIGLLPRLTFMGANCSHKLWGVQIYRAGCL